jgi:hypothetical protein
MLDPKAKKVLDSLVHKLTDDELNALYDVFATANIENLYALLNTAISSLNDEKIRRHLDG